MGASPFTNLAGMLLPVEGAAPRFKKEQKMAIYRVINEKGVECAAYSDNTRASQFAEYMTEATRRKHEVEVITIS